MKVDYLIVGQGIAGTIISFLLQQNNKSICVVDPVANQNASKVSVGICNPIVFKRLTKSWLANSLLAEAKTTYGAIEEYLGTTLIDNKHIFKLLSSDDEVKLWERKAFDPDLMDFISLDQNHDLQDNLTSALGFGKVKDSIQIAVEKMLRLYQEKVFDQNKFLKAEFDHSALQVEKSSVKWNNIEAKKVIFCEGYEGSKNPFFSWLPFKLTKGEIIIIKSEALKLDAIINKGVTVFPMGDDLYWVGATYEWDDLSTTTTSEGKEELLNKLHKLLKVPFQVVTQKVGIRPTVKDRRPIIGQHPSSSNLIIFNGLGTKGTMIAPYFGKQLINFIENGDALNNEVDIKRFYSYFEANESV